MFVSNSRHILREYSMRSILHSTGVCMCIKPDFSGVKCTRHGDTASQVNTHDTRRHPIEKSKK
ncbi:hypothetical protein FQN60_002254 [Etheostoma spectabile]|uniref:Uncharacterized protein n=1 Tax=Etheostoma spectabile TaxID=54343 RepID=A0A5J5DDV8_9PERO|nr:hypothetical protein FQN60_002254 [Etheostoma spectabile]